ncbi:MAG TPA: SUMF1/EgtB/PvdO family nonheme iron enzyme, partial [Candidatus Deferrimicrobium sp.]|nr:SUMF1/EgtB/PvdO family nonheme iron enzyme [Candidatus Deferrimicrobium sp.]
MSEITILHLSDIHFKKKKDEDNDELRKIIQERLIEAVTGHAGKEGNLHPDFVVITGDIAFSGKQEEYDEALKFLFKLKAGLPKETEFLVVPGNHDVDRDEVDPCFPIYQNIIKEDKIADFLGNRKHLVNTIHVKFKYFKEFVKELAPELYPGEEDYFWFKDYKSHGVSFLGLNSCWASGGDNENLQIALGYPQLMKALEKSGEKNKILLMHHPLSNWLDEKDTRKCEGEILSRCRLVLHGHSHLDDAKIYKDPSFSCIHLGANASYTKDKEDYIGFQFIEAGFLAGGVTLKVWPYRLDSRTRTRFVPDTYRWEKQAGKPYYQLESMEPVEPVEPPEPEPPVKKPPLPLVIPVAYKEWVKEFHSTMDIDYLAGKGEVITVTLPEVYIPIVTLDPSYKEKMKKGEDMTDVLTHIGALKNKDDEQKPSYIDIEELVGRKKRVLLRGGAGMGKTTLIKHLAYTITNGNCRTPLKDRLPVIVFLKDLWLIYNEELQKTRKKIIFEDLMALYLEKSKCRLPWQVVENYLAHEKALFLIDGLDEVPQNLRADLVTIIAAFQFEHKANHFLVTGRAHGIDGRAMAVFGSDLHDIEPVDEPRAADFIEKWFRAVSGQAKGLGKMTAQSMITDIRQHEHISIFTQNPLLLTAMCILYKDGKRIPDQRAELYNRVIDNLIHRRFHDPAQPGKEKTILSFLMRLAFENQVKNRKSMDMGDALKILTETVPRESGEKDPCNYRRIEELFNDIEPGCGLFNRSGNGEIGFAHLSFQEFLAAKYMVYMEMDCDQYLENKWWEEALLLYTGLVSLDRKKKSNEIVDLFLAQNHFLLAGKALYDFQPAGRDETVVLRVCDRLREVIESDAGLEERFQAGLLLGGLGDSRIFAGPGSIEPVMEEVPAGDFTRGSKKAKEEQPVRKIYLDKFMMGKYPVTNGEFKSFILDGGYNNKDYWTAEGWQWRQEKNISEPGFWHDRKWNGPNFPVVRVSWYEA